MTDSPVTPEQLASALAARLIHDVIGPAGGIVSAFDVAEDPRHAAMRDEALTMAASAARGLVATMILIRAIYGGGEAALSAADLETAARRLFTAPRAELNMRIGSPPTATSTRVFLGLVQIMAMGVASGGTVTGVHDAAPEGLAITIRAAGPRVQISEEVYAGLACEPLGSGKPHRWSTAYLIGAVARSSGGGVQAGVVEGGVAFRAVIRTDMA